MVTHDGGQLLLHHRRVLGQSGPKLDILVVVPRVLQVGVLVCPALFHHVQAHSGGAAFLIFLGIGDASGASGVQPGFEADSQPALTPPGTPPLAPSEPIWIDNSASGEECGTALPSRWYF